MNMKIRFDSRVEKYVFYFVIVYLLFSCALVCILRIIDNLGTDAGALEYLPPLQSISALFLVVIPLIAVYKLPWEKRDLGFAPKETKIALVFLGILVLLDTIDFEAPGLLGFLSYPAIALLFVIIFVLVRKQSFESVGITLKNFKNSMLILIIPLAYLIACISLSHFSMRSIGVIALDALFIGISEEIIWRGFPIFRLESLGKVTAVLITGVLFAAVHINNLGLPSGIIYFLAVLPVGLGWGLISLKTRNILPLILIHFFADTAGLL